MAPSPKQRAVTMKRSGFDDSLVGAVLGITAADVQSLIYDADPDVELPGAAVAVELPVFQTSVDVTYDEMVTLPSARIELVEDPGRDRVIVPSWAFLQMGEEGDFGGFSNASVNPNVSVGVVGPDHINRLSRLTPRTEFHSLFATGEAATLGIEQTTDVTTGGAQEVTHGRPIDDYVGGLFLRAFNSGVIGANFEPVDEGGYPDAVLRVTVIYSVIDRVS